MVNRNCLNATCVTSSWRHASILIDTHKRIYTGEKPFGCDVCDTRLTFSLPLESHQLAHTGERTFFSCDVCGIKLMTNRDNVTRHLMIRSGVKTFTFTCAVRHLQFSRGHHLKAHMRTDTLEKPYICILCVMQFTASNSLMAGAQTDLYRRKTIQLWSVPLAV